MSGNKAQGIRFDCISRGIGATPYSKHANPLKVCWALSIYYKEAGQRQKAKNGLSQISFLTLKMMLLVVFKISSASYRDA